MQQRPADGSQGGAPSSPASRLRNTHTEPPRAQTARRGPASRGKLRPEQKNRPSIPATELRRLAEQRLQQRESETARPGTEQDTLRLLHELQVHQIELEMQNEELSAARMAADAGLARYTDLYDFAPVAYFTLTREGQIVEVNLTGATLLGTVRHKLIRRGLGRFVAPQEQGRWLRHLADVLQSSERQSCELPFCREDGSTFYARLDCVRLDQHAAEHRGRGPLPAMRVALSDVTERRQAERRQHLLTAILGNLNEAVAFGDAIRLILAAIQQETGLDAVGIRLRSGDDFPYFVQSGFSRDFLLAENALAVRARDGGVCRDQDGNISLECTCGLVLSGKTDPTDALFTPGGSCWTNDSSFLLDLSPAVDPRLHPRNRCVQEGFRSVALIPIRANREIVGLLQLNDRRKDRFTLDTIRYFEGLSASIGVALVRKRAEEALCASEARHRSFIEVTGQLGWTTDAAGQVTEDLPSWRRFTGQTMQEIQGAGWTRALHPDDVARTAALWRHAVGERQNYEIEYRIRRHDGVYRHFLARGMPVLREDGTVLEWVGTCIDITDRKRAEVTLHQVAAELERSNKDLEQFATVVSHDLQEPLRAVTGYLGLLRAKYRGRLDDQADVFLAGAADGAVRMQRLIDDLLAYSRLGTRGGTLQPAPAEDALDAALANLATAVGEAGAVVTREPLPTVCADRSQLAQLFQNLVGNAVKFRGDATPRIHVAAVRQQQNWLFSVGDNGIGIDPAGQERIFEIFQRLHPQVKYPGTGIGLPICKRIVERHGGRIWVESRPGLGATFFFTLPVREERPE